jgi:methylenetetrahydrofolate dehydrogenase (NADP+)/methenyltetrahydrofolate cyclohydrolase
MPLLDGKSVAEAIRLDVAKLAGEQREAGTVPTLAIIVATDDPQAAWYVRSIVKAAKSCYIEAKVIQFPADATTENIAEAIHDQANDDAVHGIILQTPLPTGVNIDALLPLIPIAKDIDGASPESAGRLSFGLPCFVPATAEAVMVLLEKYAVETAGKHAVIVGRSRVVGKPVAQLLLAAHATVTIAHSRTPDLASLTTEADILVVAAGKPHLIEPDQVKPEAVVIDVGTNVTPENQLVGDVDSRVAEHASLSPVPGGVGPVTTAIILQHTVTAVSGSFGFQK